MQLKIKERVERDRGREPEWLTVAVWPDSDGEPQQGGMILISGQVLRVAAVLRTGPATATVYAEPTFMRTSPADVEVAP